MMAAVHVRVGKWLATVDLSPRAALLLAFLAGVAVRMMPELLAFPHPIGFDTIYYGWRLADGTVWAHWSQVFSSSWLLYALLVPLSRNLQMAPFAVLKVAMPVLFGVTVGGVYYVAVKGLHWSVRKGLLAAVLFSCQLAALRMSSDLYRNVLGLGILLFAVPWLLKERPDARSLGVFSVLSLLAVFSHEYIAILLLVAIVGVVIRHSLNGARAATLKVSAAAVPAIAAFLAGLLLRIYPVYKVTTPHVLSVNEPGGAYAGPLFFMTNYLAGSSTNHGAYMGLFASVASLFALMYAAIIPLALVGFFRHQVFDVWTGFLCVGAFGCLAVPVCALQFWSRWMVLLVLPLIFYAANGFAKVLQAATPLRATLWRLGSFTVSQRVAKRCVLVSVTMGILFVASPMFLGLGGVYSVPTTVAYLPSTMLANTIPLSDVEDTMNVFRWVNGAMDGDSCFLAQVAFAYWARLSLDGQHTVVMFSNDVARAVACGAEQGFVRFWLVWWDTDIGWHGFAVPDEFEEVYRAGRMSVYEYSG